MSQYPPQLKRARAVHMPLVLSEEDEEEMELRNYNPEEVIELGSEDEELVPLEEIHDSDFRELLHIMQEKADEPGPDDRPEPPKQTVRWAFTWQLPEGLEHTAFCKLTTHFDDLLAQGKIRYAVGGLEYSPTTGKPHCQGYVELNTGKKLRAPGFKKVIALKELGDPHVEGAYSSGKANRVYCLKDGGGGNLQYTFEVGEMGLEPGEKMKANFNETVRLARMGEFDAVAPSHLVQYFGNLQKIHFSGYRPLKDNPNFFNYWITGPPGVGKSRLARCLAGDDPAYFKDAGNKWFDAYNHEQVVILDDMEKDAKHMGHLLKLVADRYPCRVEIKGASTMIRPDMVIVTSNYHIAEIFEDKSCADAITRRFRIIELNAWDDEWEPLIKEAKLGKITVIGGQKPALAPVFQPTQHIIHPDGTYENKQ